MWLVDKIFTRNSLSGILEVVIWHSNDASNVQILRSKGRVINPSFYTKCYTVKSENSPRKLVEKTILCLRNAETNVLMQIRYEIWSAKADCKIFLRENEQIAWSTWNLNKCQTFYVKNWLEARFIRVKSDCRETGSWILFQHTNSRVYLGKKKWFGKRKLSEPTKLSMS